MNVAITVMLTVSVIVPEVLGADWKGSGARKRMLPVEQMYGSNLKVMWDFEGIMRYSPLFYGFYSKESESTNGAGYPVPLAYFCAGMAVYAALGPRSTWAQALRQDGQHVLPLGPVPQLLADLRREVNPVAQERRVEG